MITIAIVIGASALGLAVAVIAMLQAGISREEADHSLLAEPATCAASVTRRLVGLYVRIPDRVTGSGPQDAARLAQRPPRRAGR
jgi:hypothetical protein